MTITVTLTATATDEWLAAAEAPDCESAVLAARTLWHDAQQAERELRRSSSAYSWASACARRGRSDEAA